MPRVWRRHPTGHRGSPPRGGRVFPTTPVRPSVSSTSAHVNRLTPGRGISIRLPILDSIEASEGGDDRVGRRGRVQPGGGPRHDLRRGRGRPRTSGGHDHPRRPDSGRTGGGVRPGRRIARHGRGREPPGGEQPGPGRPGVQASPRRPHARDARRHPARGDVAARRAPRGHRREGHRDRGRPTGERRPHPPRQLGPLPARAVRGGPAARGPPAGTDDHRAGGGRGPLRGVPPPRRRRHGGRVRPRRRHVRRHRAAQARRRHRHPRQPRGHRAARRRRLRRRDPRPHQLQLRRRAERARPEQPADRHRPGPAAAGLHRGEGGALDRHRGVHPGVPAEPALRRPPHARRVRRHDPRPDRVDDRRADPHAAFRACRAHRPQCGAAGRAAPPGSRSSPR